MAFTKTDYSDEVRSLLKENYEPVESKLQVSEYTCKMTLTGIYKELTSILPKRWIDESDVYDALQELGFKSFLYTFEAIHNKEGELIVPERSALLYLLDKKTAAI